MMSRQVNILLQIILLLSLGFKPLIFMIYDNIGSHLKNNVCRVAYKTSRFILKCIGIQCLSLLLEEYCGKALIIYYI